MRVERLRCHPAERPPRRASCARSCPAARRWPATSRRSSRRCASAATTRWPSSAARFDGVEGPLLRRAAGARAALAALRPRVLRGLELAADNVRVVAEAGVGEDRELRAARGPPRRRCASCRCAARRSTCRAAARRTRAPWSWAPSPRVPRASRRSSSARPARHPVILAACALCGVREVYRTGGAHAVAALALGTDSIQRVDVIAGPGSLYVQEAKRQLSGEVGIDSFAGPSDVLVVADAARGPRARRRRPAGPGRARRGDDRRRREQRRAAAARRSGRGWRRPARPWRRSSTSRTRPTSRPSPTPSRPSTSS